MDTSDNGRSPDEQKHRFFYFAIIVLGILISSFVSFSIYTFRNKQLQVEFSALVSDNIENIQKTLQADVNFLVAVESFFFSSRSVESSEFQNFVHPFFKEQMGLEAIAWAPVVSQAEKKAFEQKARDEVSANYRLWRYISNGKQVEVKTNLQYLPVYYIAPFHPYSRLLGFDLATNSVFRTAFRRALKTKHVTSTGVIALSEDNINFIAVLNPVFLKQRAIYDPSSIYESLNGFVVGFYRIDKLIERAIAASSEGKFKMAIYDVSPRNKKQFLYEYDPSSKKTSRALINFERARSRSSVAKIINVPGREWVAVCSPLRKEFFSKYWTAFVFFFFGTFISYGIARYYRLSIRREEEIKKVVQERTSYLNQAKQHLEQEINEHKKTVEELKYLAAIVQSSNDAIIGMTIRGIILSWNAGAEMMYGYREIEIIGRHISVLLPDPGSDEIENIMEKIRTGESIYQHETIRKTKDGREIYVLLTKFPVRGKDGKVLGAAAIARDITERKLSEQALKKANDDFTQVVSEVPCIIWKAEMNEKFELVNTYISGVVDKLLCVEKGSIGNDFQKYFSYVHSDDLPGIFHLIKQVVATESFGKHSSYDYRVIRHDKQIRWFRSTGSARLSSNQKVQLFGITEDITERKQAEESLKEQEATFQALTTSAQDAIVMMDNLGAISFWNSSAERIFGWKKEEVIGKNLHNVLAPERYLASHRNAFSHFQTTGKGSAVGNTLELYGLKKDGTEILTELSLSAVQIQHRWHAVGILRDITERKKIEIRLDQVNNCLLSLREDFSENINRLTALCGELLEGSYALYNRYEREAFTISGWWNAPASVLEEAVTKGCVSYDVMERYETDAYYVSELQKTSYLNTDPAVKDQELRSYFGHVVKWGETPVGVLSVFYKKNFHPTDADKRLIGIIAAALATEEARRHSQDALRESENSLRKTLEDARKAHTELQLAQKQLVQSEKLAAIGQLAAGIAHEINNPTGFIGSNLSTLSKSADSIVEVFAAVEELQDAIKKSDADKAGKVIERIEKVKKEANLDYIIKDLNNLLRESSEGVARITKIVQDLKTFSRADAGTKVMSNINSILDKVLSIVWNELKYKAEVNKDYANIPAIECNEQQIGQVFINLLVNAAQAIEQKGVITVRTYSFDGNVCVEVADTGKGILPKDARSIFEPFFTTKPAGKGTGLGLSISYEIVKKHNGDITFESEAGKGATFKVVLPIKSAK